MYYIFLAVVDIVLNKIIIMTCGVELIPAYAVINLVFGTCEVYEALTNASMGLVTCFLGERNSHDMNLVFRKIWRTLLVMAIGLWAVFFFGAPLMPLLCSIAVGTLWGFTGIAIGMMLSPYMAFAVYAIALISLRGKKNFPFYYDAGEESWQTSAV